MAQNYRGTRHGTGGQLSDLEEWDLKEKSYWSLFYRDGIDHYLSYFQACPVQVPRSVEVLRPSSELGTLGELPLEIAADFSANMFDLPAAADRIREAYGAASPHLRFVVLLDDPIQIFHSFVYMQLKHHKAQFEEAAKLHGTQDLPPFVAAARMQLANARACMPEPNKVDSAALQRCRGTELLHATWNLQAAMAGPLLKHWLSVFKESHFIVISSRSYYKDPWRTVENVATLLGLPVRQAALEVLQAIKCQGRNNKNVHKRSLNQEPSELLAEIKAFYTPYVKILKEILASKADGRMTVMGEFKWINDY